MRWPALAAILGAVAAAGLSGRNASAIPTFAHQYGVTCQKCHSVIPHLNEFGAAFLANGERIPGVQPGPAVPISGKLNLADSSQYQGPGLPKAIVDEVEVFIAGAIGTRASGLFEQYIVDGGNPGLTRDAWVTDRVNPWQARIPVFAQGGSFTLPVPVDPETFRDTSQHYTIFDQTAGANPFNFFDPKIGARMSFGDPLRGLSGQVFAGPGHDRQSGLPTYGTDWMGVAQDAMGFLTVTAYHYSGARLLPGGVVDNFWRNGAGLVYNNYTRWEWDNVLQQGWDTNCESPGYSGCATSGGFTQLRYMFNAHLFAEARYEGTQDPTNRFQRDGVILLGYGPTENTRITLEDVISHVPQTTHTMNLQFTIAY